jgi:hypothetical protein
LTRDNNQLPGWHLDEFIVIAGVESVHLTQHAGEINEGATLATIDLLPVGHPPMLLIIDVETGIEVGVFHLVFLMTALAARINWRHTQELNLNCMGYEDP